MTLDEATKRRNNYLLFIIAILFLGIIFYPSSIDILNENKKPIILFSLIVTVVSILVIVDSYQNPPNARYRRKFNFTKVDIVAGLLIGMLVYNTYQTQLSFVLGSLLGWIAMIFYHRLPWLFGVPGQDNDLELKEK